MHQPLKHSTRQYQVGIVKESHFCMCVSVVENNLREWDKVGNWISEREMVN